MNGLAALETLNSKSIDILITDIRMPHMDGLTLIKKAMQLQPDLKTVILTAHDEFSYVKEAIHLGVENYILKPVSTNEFADTMQKISEKLDRVAKNNFLSMQSSSFKDNLLNRWISGSIEVNEFMERAPFVNIPLHAGCYLVALIKIIGYKNDNLLQSMIKMCNESLMSSFSGYCFVDKLDQLVILLHHTEPLKDYDVKAAILQTIQRINRELEVDTFATLGNSVDTPYEVSQSYHIAKNLQDYSLLMPKNKVLSMTDLKKDSSDAYLMDKIDFARFEKLISDYRTEEALALISELFENLKAYSPSVLYHEKQIVAELLLRISILIRKQFVRFESIPDTLKNFYETFNAINSYDVLLPWLNSVIYETVALLKNNMSQKSTLTANIISYIQLNYYDNDISLKTIASRFHVNSSYLGQLFKAEVGELFNIYLNQIRIEKAMVLIRDKNIKLSTIAERVGYSNSSYFQKIFQKTTGHSPSEFKRLDEHSPLKTF